MAKLNLREVVQKRINSILNIRENKLVYGTRFFFYEKNLTFTLKIKIYLFNTDNKITNYSQLSSNLCCVYDIVKLSVTVCKTVPVY